MTFSRAAAARPHLLRCLLSVLTCLVACDSESTRQWDAVDQPPPVPREVAGPDIAPEEPVEPGEPDPSLVQQCVRGTGKNEQGECEALRRRESERGQQVQMPRGTFVMGDIPDRYDAQAVREEPRSRWSGNPPRQLDIEGYWIDLHEVTRGAYAACVEQGKCTPAKCEQGELGLPADVPAEVLDSVPQTCVTHEQAEAFCQAQGGRLPTEAQWEYAARGVDARLYPWGNSFADEHRHMLMPVGGAVDLSYFGLRGMGSNALEWVAEPFALDVGLQAYVDGEFRRPDGPLTKAFAASPAGHVVKGGRAGARRQQVGFDKLVGFRCAADLEPGATALQVPAAPPPVPLIASADNLQIFGGVAEAVDRKEAEAFCEALKVEAGGSTYEDWRLPSLAEIQASADLFKGPGPFWTQEGAAVQRGEGPRPKADDPWQAEDAQSTEPLAARCVR